MTNQERRNATRYPMIVPLAHRKFVFGRDVEVKVDPKSHTEDLSAVGLRFVSSFPYIVGDMVYLEIPISGWVKFSAGFTQSGSKTTVPVIVLGKVVRVEEDTVGDHVSVLFVGIDADHQQALKKYLSSKKSV